MGESEVPDSEYAKRGPQPTVVPFRNGTFISIATAIAHRFTSSSEVWIATHSDDGEGWAYPDCRPEFLEPMGDAVEEATRSKVRLIAPWLWYTKANIVEKAAEIRAPLHLSYSCYRGNEIHCGDCATCRDRHKAFEKADFIDPTKYANPLARTVEGVLNPYPIFDRRQ